MKRIIEDTEASGLESLMGKKVLLMCANYFYVGKLVGVNQTCVELEDAGIVYETGEWPASSFKDVQKLHAKRWFVSVAAIESYGEGK